MTKVIPDLQPSKQVRLYRMRAKAGCIADLEGSIAGLRYPASRFPPVVSKNEAPERITGGRACSLTRAIAKHIYARHFLVRFTNSPAGCIPDNVIFGKSRGGSRDSSKYTDNKSRIGH